MSTTSNFEDEAIRTPGGILIPKPSLAVSTLDGSTSEYLRLLSLDNYQLAPEGTPETIRCAYTAFASAILSAERLRHEVTQLHPTTAQRRIRETLDQISQAADAYQAAKIHLIKTEQDWFAEANHRLCVNYATVLNDPMRLRIAFVSGSWPPLEGLKVLSAIQTQIADMIAARVKPVDPYASAKAIAIELGKSETAVESWLTRHADIPNCRHTPPDRRKGDPKFLYRRSVVLPLLREHFGLT